MSYNLLPFDHEEALQNLPSYNRINNTLLLIETVRNLPNPSLTCLDGVPLNDHLNQEDSLGIQIQEKQKSSKFSQQTIKIETPDSKKKKAGCTCKKTKCLKMYCECFALGKTCTPQCACYSCCNTDKHQELIERAKCSVKSKSSRKNVQGCTCKKSQCQKKYCQCFNAGVPCSSACKCCDCQNHKDESSCSVIHSSKNLEYDMQKNLGMVRDIQKGEKIKNKMCNISRKDNLAYQEVIEEALNSENFVSNFENQGELELNGQNQDYKNILELTSYKDKKCCEQQEMSSHRNLGNLKSFESLDLCGYFN